MRRYSPLLAEAQDPPAGLEAALNASRGVIADLFSLMQQRSQEFGFLTMTEIMRYPAVDHELAPNKQGWSWQRAIDAQITQKILPKLHGARKRIEPSLIDLAQWIRRVLQSIVPHPNFGG